MAKIPKNSRTKAAPVCEYGTVDAFLTAVSDQSAAEVFLAPVYRPLAHAVQAGALLTGQRLDDPSRIHLCIVLAAQALLVGERGRIIYPYRQRQQDPQVRTLVSSLQQELLAALQHALQHDARVARLRYPASYQVPAPKTWSLNALLGFPVRYQDGHWSAARGAPQRPS